ncbi:MAG: AAA family ATPase [Paraclostridium sp.]
MRPIKLKISGLNSYIDEQVIDFEKLTERGLFGIFGQTGSGKSTILDAITIAMYGNIPRNTKEFINSACDRASISYEFEIGGQNTRRRYIVDRTIKRTKTGGILTNHCRLVEIHNDEQSTVLADKATDVNKKIAEVVGLTADDFTRSVVLPQGKFNDFLKLTGSERRNMLERIFGLEKYGRFLIDKVRQRKSEQNKNLLILNTRLSGFEGVSEEEYEKVSNELKEINEKEKILRENLETIQNKYEQYKEIYERQIDLEKYKLRKNELDLKSLEIKDKEKQLDLAFRAEKINPYIDTINSLEKSIKKDKINIDEIDKKFNEESQALIILKNQYDEIKTKKDTELPKLSEQKVKIERAIELEKQVNNLDIELVDLRNNYKKIILDKEQLEKNKSELESRKIILDRSLKDLEVKGRDLRISADLKQKIFLAYDIEKEYEVKSKEKKKVLEKQNNLNSEINDVELKHKTLNKHKKDITEKLEELNDTYEKLIKKCPGDNETIINQNEIVSNLKSKIDLTKDIYTKRDSIKEQLSSIDEQRFKLDREINSTVDKIERESKEINILEKELDKLKYLNLANELRKELKENTPCPVCGSVHHSKTDDSNVSDHVDYVQSKLEKHKSEEKTLKAKLEEYNLKNSSIKSVQEIKKQEISDLNNKIGNVELIDITKRYEEEKRKLELVKVTITTWQKDKLEIESKLSVLKEEKYNVDKEFIRLDEYINNLKNSIKDVKRELANIEIIYNEIKSKNINAKSTLKINDIKSKVEEINKNEKILETIDKEIDEKQKLKNENNEALDLIQKQIHEKDLESSRLKDLGQEKKSIRDEKYNELVGSTKGKSANVILENIELEINTIIKQEKVLNTKLDDKQKQVESYKAEKSNIEGSLNKAQEQYKEQEKILNKLLSEHKFESIYIVKKCLMDESNIITLKDEIAKHQEEEKRISIKIQDLKEKIGDNYISREIYDELRQKLQDTRIMIENLTIEKGAKQLHINNLKEALDKIASITTEFKKVQHKVDLLDDLDKVIQGNRLVEYVATSQLKYIAIEASKRLKDITKGRYALEIDSTLNFVMRDDFNGGIRRSVDTLSGGETFLTSLSLALALSSQIQLKGSAPLEFFFLDEGFGSLDTELLDTVMSSLERLHSDRLSVGIITHVEELKNRVPVKLVVKPSEAGTGSKVKIEYS